MKVRILEIRPDVWRGECRIPTRSGPVMLSATVAAAPIRAAVKRALARVGALRDDQRSRNVVAALTRRTVAKQIGATIGAKARTLTVQGPLFDEAKRELGRHGYVRPLGTWARRAYLTGAQGFGAAAAALAARR